MLCEESCHKSDQVPLILENKTNRLHHLLRDPSRILIVLLPRGIWHCRTHRAEIKMSVIIYNAIYGTGFLDVVNISITPIMLS